MGKNAPHHPDLRVSAPTVIKVVHRYTIQAKPRISASTLPRVFASTSLCHDTIRRSVRVSTSVAREKQTHGGPLAGTAFDLYATTAALDDLF